jgi:hypothetical protein
MTTMTGQPETNRSDRPFGPVWADYLAAKARFFAQLEGDPDAAHAHEGESPSDFPVGVAGDVD